MNSRRANRKPRDGRASPRPRPDARIDLSEIPPLTQAFFEHAARNPFYRPVKQSTTVRLDADVLAWLRSQGPGYQTRLNAILRAAMLKDAARERPGNHRPG